MNKGYIVEMVKDKRNKSRVGYSWNKGYAINKISNTSFFIEISSIGRVDEVKRFSLDENEYKEFSKIIEQVENERARTKREKAQDLKNKKDELDKLDKLNATDVDDIDDIDNK